MPSLVVFSDGLKRGKQGRRIRDKGGKSDKVQRSISRGSNPNDGDLKGPRKYRLTDGIDC